MNECCWHKDTSLRNMERFVGGECLVSLVQHHMLVFNRWYRISPHSPLHLLEWTVAYDQTPSEELENMPVS